MCTIRRFYPRSPCGERLSANNHIRVRKRFLSTLSLRRATRDTVDRYMESIVSIHALLAESDQDKFFVSPAKKVSIHALLAESDWVLMGGLSCDGSFYPRSPCGERPRRESRQQPAGGFYPRSPCGERRNNFPSSATVTIVSIHALLAESD